MMSSSCDLAQRQPSQLGRIGSGSWDRYAYFRTNSLNYPEITDAAMGERAECVMLNKGPAVVEAVSLLDRLMGRMNDHMFKKTPTLRALKSW